MKKHISMILAAAIACGTMVFPVSSAEDPALPFALEAPKNVSAVWMEGNDSFNAIDIHYSKNNSLSAWLTRKADPDQYDTVMQELADMGYDDIWGNAQIDWSIDSTDDWKCNEYWASGGYDGDYVQHLGDWAYTDCWCTEEIEDSAWVFRFMGNINDPEDTLWYGAHYDGSDYLGWGDVLKEDQYEKVPVDDELWAKIDMTKHTIYFRVRWAITVRPNEAVGDFGDIVVCSDWSDIAAVGKDAEKIEPLKQGDIDAPVIYDLHYTEKEFNGFPVIAFKLDVSETLNEQIIRAGVLGGCIDLIVEARILGTTDWIGLQGDWVIKSGDMEIALQNLAEDAKKVPKDTPIELRARYGTRGFDPDIYSDWSETLVFGAQDMTVTTSTYTETTQSTTTTTAPVKKFLFGDVNQDDLVNVKDSQAALIAAGNVRLGLEAGITDEQLGIADVDGDGRCTVKDAQYILIYYANTRTGTECSWRSLTGNPKAPDYLNLDGPPEEGTTTTVTTTNFEPSTTDETETNDETYYYSEGTFIYEATDTNDESTYITRYEFRSTRGTTAAAAIAAK